MPTIGPLIAGTLVFLFGAVIITNRKEFSKVMVEQEVYQASQPFMTYIIGTVLMYLGLHTLNFSLSSILILIPSILIIGNYRWVGEMLSAFFSRDIPAENRIKTGQRVLLLVMLAWSGWAIYLSVNGWFE